MSDWVTTSTGKKLRKSAIISVLKKAPPNPPKKRTMAEVLADWQLEEDEQDLLPLWLRDTEALDRKYEQELVGDNRVKDLEVFEVVLINSEKTYEVYEDPTLEEDL